MRDRDQEEYAREKILKDAGWKIHHKDGWKKFWESPHDKKIYITDYALIAQDVAEKDKRAEYALRRAKELEEQSTRYNLEEVLDEDVDSRWPPPKEKTK